MADRVSALLAEAPGLERASRLSPVTVEVPEPFRELLPLGGLRPGSTVGIAGVGATSLAYALLAPASRTSWVACVGASGAGLTAAAELGVDLDRLILVPDPGDQWTAVLSAAVDAFDVVLVHPPSGRARAQLGRPHRLNARVREQDAVLVSVGGWPEADVALRGGPATWHGIGQGHGYLRARTLEVVATGRGASARPRHTTLWLPDADGAVRTASEEPVLKLVRA